MHSTHTSESGRMDPRGLFKGHSRGALNISRRRDMLYGTAMEIHV